MVWLTEIIQITELLTGCIMHHFPHLRYLVKMTKVLIMKVQRYRHLRMSKWSVELHSQLKDILVRDLTECFQLTCKL